MVNGNDHQTWGFSSVGRTLPLQGRGQEFNSPKLHQSKKSRFILPTHYLSPSSNGTERNTTNVKMGVRISQGMPKYIYKILTFYKNFGII